MNHEMFNLAFLIFSYIMWYLELFLYHKENMYNIQSVSGDKEAMRNMRLSAIERLQTRTRENETKKTEQKRQDDKYALKRQMKVSGSLC